MPVLAINPMLCSWHKAAQPKCRLSRRLRYELHGQPPTSPSIEISWPCLSLPRRLTFPPSNDRVNFCCSPASEVLNINTKRVLVQPGPFYSSRSRDDWLRFAVQSVKPDWANKLNRWLRRIVGVYLYFVAWIRIDVPLHCDEPSVAHVLPLARRNVRTRLMPPGDRRRLYHARRARVVRRYI